MPAGVPLPGRTYDEFGTPVPGMGTNSLFKASGTVFGGGVPENFLDQSPASSPQPPSGPSSSPFTPVQLETTDEGRRALFGALRPGFLQTGQQKDIFRSMFDRIFDDYQTQVGQAALTGGAPSTFTDFLKGRDLGRQTRREGIGRNTSPLVSAANFLFNR